MKVHKITTNEIITMSQNQTPILTALGIDYPVIYAITHRIGAHDETRYIDLDWISITSVQMSSGNIERLWHINYKYPEKRYSYTVFETGIRNIRVLPKIELYSSVHNYPDYVFNIC